MKYGIWQYLYQRNDNNIDDEEILNHFRKLIRRKEKEEI